MNSASDWRGMHFGVMLIVGLSLVATDRSINAIYLAWGSRSVGFFGIICSLLHYGDMLSIFQLKVVL